MVTAKLQSRRIAIPKSIQKLGGGKEFEDRLRTTFQLIERTSDLSSKALEDELKEIRSDFTRSLSSFGDRVVLKAQKPNLATRLAAFKKTLESHRGRVRVKLQKTLDTSRIQVVDYFLPLVLKNPPDSLRDQLTGEPGENEIRAWLDHELMKVFPTVEDLTMGMELEESYKDVTFETLNHSDFIHAVLVAYPYQNWNKVYAEFKAAGEPKKTAPGM